MVLTMTPFFRLEYHVFLGGENICLSGPFVWEIEGE